MVDENGKEYEKTYIKRAKGLVKNGRARFIDSNTICLACPAQNQDTEDIKMTETTINGTQNENIKTEAEKISVDKSTGEVFENTAETGKTDNESLPTLMYVISQIERISRDTDYIREALNELKNIKSAGPGDICGQGKADAIAHVVDAREDTNRKLIGFYEMLYKDIQSTEKSKNKIPSQLLEIIHCEEDYEARLEMFHDLCNFFA